MTDHERQAGHDLAEHDLDQEAMDRVMHAGLQLLATQQRREAALAPRRPASGRQGPWLLLVALLAVGVTLAVAVLEGRAPVRQEAQDPDGIPPSWRDALAAAPVVETRAAVDRLPADTAAVRLAPPTSQLIAGLARLRELRAIALIGTDSESLLTLHADISAALLRHTRIEALELEIDAADAERLAPLERLPGLRELRIRISNGLTPLTVLPSAGLQRLAIDLHNAKPRGWQEFVTRSRELRALEIDGAREVDASLIEQLSKLTELRELALRRHRIDTSLVAAIARLPLLEELELRDGSAPDVHAFEPLRHHGRIRRISLARTSNLVPRHVADLAMMPNLAELDLEFFGTMSLGPTRRVATAMPAAALAALTRAPALRRVSLRGVTLPALDELQDAAAGWDRLDLTEAILMPPGNSPQGSGPLDVTDPEALRKLLDVKELIL